MSYQVIARKWRPQSFEQLVGQDHISTTLLNALRSQRLHQALLFTGPRGTGKTSTARILAKSLRCEKSDNYVPCGTCPSCEEIARGSGTDVREMDAASNTGVDSIRELNESVRTMPQRGRHKIYIIDEVHMLSTSAFNALLKTLEEPPPHVIFVLATTEVQKIPITILSRCQRFDFRSIPSRQIADQLAKVTQGEGVKAEPEALWLIARQAGGSMRDSQSLLDQVITFSGSEVTLAKTIDVLGLTDRTVLLETLQALVARDTQKVVDVIEKIFKAGYDTKVFAQDLLEELRHALLVRACAQEPSRVVDLPDTEIQHLREITTALTDEDIHLLFDMALKGINDLLRSQEPRLILEMLLLRMAAAPRIQSLMQWTAAPAPGAPAPTPAAPAAQPGRPPERRATPAHKTAAAPVSESIAQSVAPAPKSAPSPARKPETSDTAAAPASSDPWVQFVHRVKKSNGFLGALLENTTLISSTNDHVEVGVPRKMNFLFDKINDPDNVRVIEQFIETFWSRRVKVSIHLGDEKAAKMSPKDVAQSHQQAKEKSIEQQVESDPLVRSAKSVFKTQIKSIKENT